jgi:hypothetical protein
MTILSTTSKDDLVLNNNELVQFSKSLPGVSQEKYLGFKNKWFLGSKSGCSCSFRHLSGGSVELGFGVPEDWFKEEAEDIEATRQVITAIRSLVERGERVDCVDSWTHDKQDADELSGTVEVNLSEVGDESFRFFENYRFVFLRQT